MKTPEQVAREIVEQIARAEHYDIENNGFRQRGIPRGHRQGRRSRRVRRPVLNPLGLTFEGLRMSTQRYRLLELLVDNRLAEYVPYSLIVPHLWKDKVGFDHGVYMLAKIVHSIRVRTRPRGWDIQTIYGLGLKLTEGTTKPVYRYRPMEAADRLVEALEDMPMRALRAVPGSEALLDALRHYNMVRPTSHHFRDNKSIVLPIEANDIEPRRAAY